MHMILQAHHILVCIDHQICPRAVSLSVHLHCWLVIAPCARILDPIIAIPVPDDYGASYPVWGSLNRRVVEIEAEHQV